MEPIAIVVVALAICAFGAVSGRAERSPFTPPMFFTAVGVGVAAAAAAASGLERMALESAGELIEGLAELTLVIVLFTDASRIDLACLRRESNLPARLLGIGMPLTIAAGTVGAKLVLPDLSWMEAALLSAVLTPTDAALGQAVVSNGRVPVRIRQSLNVESGLNDGIALPVVAVLASVAGALESEASASDWVRVAVLAVTLGPAVGVGVGWLGGHLIANGTRTGWVSAPFQRLAGLGLALLAYGGAELVGGNGFIAAFTAGLTVGNVTRGICTCLYEFGEAEGQLFALLVFLVFGAVMVPEAARYWDTRTFVYAILSLTVIRMAPVFLALVGSGLRWPSSAFLAWFGPRGLASILFVLLVVESGRLAGGAMIESVVITTVLLSIFLHGVTAYPLARRYADWIERSDQAEVETADVEDMPVRIRHAPPSPSPGTGLSLGG